MRRSVLPLLALPLLAASPGPRSFNLSVPLPQAPLLPTPPRPPAVTVQSALQPAPLPNRDVGAPIFRQDEQSASLSPMLFGTKETYRGDGFIKGSTAQGEQEHRVRPAAGFSLKMPLTGN